MKKVTRFRNDKLHIGTYYLAPYARTESHIKDAADCGIDFFVNIPNDATLLTMLNEYGIGAIVTGVFPPWFGGDGSNAGQMAAKNPLSRYQDALTSFTDASNIIGIDTGDEPSCLEFPHYGKIFALINESLPLLMPFLNIYPSYAVKGSNTNTDILTQLQCDTYTEYIESYCRNVSSDYICFDYYPYSASLSGLYESLLIVSDACRRYHRKMFMVLQVNSHEEHIYLSANKLRFQAFTAMAFGTETIIWACYTAGWWYNHVLDKSGEKTEQYEKLKKVNSEIHFLGSEYRKYTYQRTHFLGKHADTKVHSEASLSTGFVKDFHSENNNALLVSIMDSDSSNALFICAANDYKDEHPYAFSISFKTKSALVTLYKNEMKQHLFPNTEHTYHFEMYPNEGALLTFS